MLRVMATLVILALLALDAFLPSTSLGRRGTEADARLDVPGAFAAVGERMPEFELLEIGGGPVRLADLAGQRAVVTFERSVDW
jgi:hypothetical protein